MVQGVELRWITSLASQLRRRSISTGRERERVARPELTGLEQRRGKKNERQGGEDDSGDQNSSEFRLHV